MFWCFVFPKKTAAVSVTLAWPVVRAATGHNMSQAEKCTSFLGTKIYELAQFDIHSAVG